MGEFSNLNEEGSMSTDDQQSGHLHANMAAALPKSDYRQSRKEVITVVLDFIETNCFKLSGKIAVHFLANLHDKFVWNFLKSTKILLTHKNINVFFTDYV